MQSTGTAEKTTIAAAQRQATGSTCDRALAGQERFRRECGALHPNHVARLYAQYGSSLRSRCLRITRDANLAEDVLHDAMVKVLRYGAKVLDADSELAWLTRVVTRCSLDALRQAAKRRATATDENATLWGHQHMLGRLEARSILRAGVHGLTAREIQVAALLYGQGASQRSVAGQVGWSRQTIHMKIKKIRRNVRHSDDA